MKTGKELNSEWDAFLQTENGAAFHALYAHYHDYLTYIGIKKGARSEKVKDCINDLFLYVFESREKLTGVKNHHNYLVTAFLRNLFRKEHFSAEESLELADLPDTHSYPSAEAQYIAQHTQEHVAEILKTYIDKLSGSQAQMIYQKFYLGLSYEEISLSNHISIKTAYNTIYNAVDRLKKMIGKEDFGIFSIAFLMIFLFFLFFFKNL